MTIATSPVQTGGWLQQLSGTVRSSLDANSDGKIDSGEVTDFLSQLLDAVKGSTANYDAATGSPIVTTPTIPSVTPKNPLEPPSTTTAGEEGTTGPRTWKDYVFGRSAANNYDGVMVQPSRDVPAGYTAGRYRGQLEGFNDAKFDPAHAEGMTLKMIAARVFEQFDVYGPTAIDDVVTAFNELGIPAQKVGLDTIDFGNGEGPIDVIRNAEYLDGNKAAGMGWQWAPVNDGTSPMNFTMGASLTPTVAAATGTAGMAGTTSTFRSPYAQPSGAGDQISASEVSWLSADVSGWPVTSTITGVDVGQSSVTIEHTKAGQWPVYDLQGAAVEGNPWIFVNRDGQWLASTYDWLRPGQTEKSVSASDIAENARDERLEPRPGELVGFMVSTIARNGDRTSNERSNIVLTTWPA